MTAPQHFAIAVALALVASSTASAQSNQDGNVAQLRVRATDGLVYAYLDGPRTTAPSCATQPFWAIANESSIAGRQQIALLTMAQASGKRVTIYGTGSCGRWPDAENIAEVVVWD
jgi:hypothetical protein